MSKIICKCGNITNTAVCDWIESKDEKADKCYIAYNIKNKKWIKGCAYNDAPLYQYSMLDRLLLNKGDI